MADLLPSTPDTTAADEAEPRVIGLDSEDADALLGAISSSTARELLAALHEDPSTASELADTVGTSLQNAQYHLGNLEEAGVIEVIDTMYSEKGREMKVFAPADRPLVVFAGGEEEKTGLRAAISRLFGGLAILALASLAVQSAFSDWIGAPTADGDAAEDGDFAATDGDAAESTPTPEEDGDAGVFAEEEDGADAAVEETATETAAPEATPTPEAETTTPVPEDAEPVTTAADLVADSGATLEGIEPGLLFFAGGAVVLLGVFALWYLNRYRTDG